MTCAEKPTNGLTEAQAERLALLIEECAEVQQVAAKILRHGYLTAEYNNRIALEHELGDLVFVLRLMAAADDLWMSTVQRFADEKPAKAAAHLHHNGVFIPKRLRGCL